LTAGHVIGYEANHVDLGIYFKWKDSLYVTPSLQNGYPQPEFGKVKVKKCYIFKRFVNSLGHLPNDDLALLILDEPVGYQIGWTGLGYVASDSFLLNNVFYNFSYPGMDGYDGLNMYYKYGQFSNVSNSLTSASNSITGIPGESGSGFFYTDNSKYTTYGIRTYSSSYTLITEDKFRILKKIIEENIVSSVDEISENLKSAVIYPNPAQDIIQVKIENLSYNLLSLTIWNLQGQIIHIERKYSIGDLLNISYLKKGLYLVEIKTDRARISKKLIVY
jgi:hypothetical protein